MKKIVITGGGGFLGQRLARELLRRIRAGLGTGKESGQQIVLLDVADPETEIVDSRVRFPIGDAADPSSSRRP
jgi:D-erythronate 2-dehydrogenase